MLASENISKVEISKRLVLINSASSLVTRLLSITVLIWLQQYLLRRITTEEYSLLPVLYSVMMFVPLITTILTSGLGRFITIAYAKGDDDEVTRIVSTMFPILCAAGLIFLAVGWMFAWHIDSVLNIAPERLWDARIMMALLTFSAALRLPLAPFGLGFFVRQKFILSNVISVLTEIFRLTLLFTLLLAVSTRVLWLVVASTGAEFVNLAVTRAISIRLVPAQRFKRGSIYWPIAKEITSFGGWSFLTEFVDTIRTGADAIILNRFATPFDVTCFHLGSLPWRQVKDLSIQVRAPLTPAVMSMYAAGDMEKTSRTYLRIGRLSLWFGMFFVVPAVCFHRQLVSLYVGPEFSPAGHVMILLLVTLPLSYACTLLPVLAQAHNCVKQFALRLSAINTLNLVLTLVLVGRYHMGAIGSALGTFITWVLLQPVLMWPLGLILARTTWLEWLKKTVAPGILPALLSGFFGLSLGLVFPLDSWLALTLGVSTTLLVYVGTIWFFCMQAEDSQDARGLVRYGIDTTCRTIGIKQKPILGKDF